MFSLMQVKNMKSLEKNSFAISTIIFLVILLYLIVNYSSYFVVLAFGLFVYTIYDAISKRNL